MLMRRKSGICTGDVSQPKFDAGSRNLSVRLISHDILFFSYNKTTSAGLLAAKTMSRICIITAVRPDLTHVYVPCTQSAGNQQNNCHILLIKFWNKYRKNARKKSIPLSYTQSGYMIKFFMKYIFIVNLFCIINELTFFTNLVK
jgi:hypothetical protein